MRLRIRGPKPAPPEPPRSLDYCDVLHNVGHWPAMPRGRWDERAQCVCGEWVIFESSLDAYGRWMPELHLITEEAL